MKKTNLLSFVNVRSVMKCIIDKNKTRAGIKNLLYSYSKN